MKIQILAIFLIIFGFYISVEKFKLKFKIDPEYTRKIAHILSGLGAIIFSGVISKNEFIFLTFVFLIIFIASYKYNIFKSFHLIKRKSYGEIFYPLSLIVLALFLYDQRLYFMIGILLLAISDAVAGLVGRLFAKDKKTDIGSLAFFIVSFAILLLGFGFVDALLIAIILVVVERISPYGFDNLTIPLSYLVMFSFLV